MHIFILVVLNSNIFKGPQLVAFRAPTLMECFASTVLSVDARMDLLPVVPTATANHSLPAN
jgi:hypothetical protein